MNTRDITPSLRHRFRTLVTRGIHFIYRTCIEPHARREDDSRHEFLLNIILTASIATTGILNLFLLNTFLIKGDDYHGFEIGILALIVAIFITLLVLSRMGYYRGAAYILVALYYLATTNGIYRWGVDLPPAILGYVIVIAISSILLGTRFGFFMTGLISVTLFSIGYVQYYNILPADSSWRSIDATLTDPIHLSVILFLIMTVAWLSNREIEKSLARARRSESDLIVERNMLEVRIEERTRELKEMQAEKIARLYRIAEFGKLSTGIFHDLMTPLQGIVTSMSEIETASPELGEMKSYLANAVAASKRMGDFLANVRRQLRPDEADVVFGINTELRQAIDMLRYRARETRVTIKLVEREPIETFGNPLKFYQVALNLISNAIDASGDRYHGSRESTVAVRLVREQGHALLTVADRGTGIPTAIREKIFDPFFTTKHASRGTGLGLSTTKHIVEKDFGGSISIKSNAGSGSIFTVTIPLRHHDTPHTHPSSITEEGIEHPHKHPHSPGKP